MKVKVLICAAAVLFVSGMLMAEDGQKGEGRGKGYGDQGKREELKSSCPECQPLAEQIKAKREIMEGLRDKMKALNEAEKAKHEEMRAKKDAEWQAKLEEVKKTDPKKAEEMIKNHEERKKEREGKKEGRKEGRDGEKREGPKDGKGGKEGEKRDGPKGPSEAELEKMKTDNPERYKIMMERQALQKELQALHDQFKECEQKNKGKDNKEK
ncbi:MAG: hypothetical protein A2044_04050 [Candidatus Firestonebacteria bacterium GWA2_43_8]|nr:MAG: hypothetical protein A2044_04050 [Candidatus Firestonebacteria bacterium GWA2_43_8]